MDEDFTVIESDSWYRSVERCSISPRDSQLERSILTIYFNSPNLPNIPKISPPRNFTAHLSSQRKEKKGISTFRNDLALTPPRGGGWNVSIGKNRWVPCYLLPRFLGQVGRDGGQRHRWCPPPPWRDILSEAHSVRRGTRRVYLLTSSSPWAWYHSLITRRG